MQMIRKVAVVTGGASGIGRAICQRTSPTECVLLFQILMKKQGKILK